MGRKLRNIGSALALSVPLVFTGCRSVDKDYDGNGHPDVYLIANNGRFDNIKLIDIPEGHSIEKYASFKELDEAYEHLKETEERE